MPIPESQKLPEQKLPLESDKPPELDKFDLAANEHLLASRGYILFTIDNEGETSFNYNPSKMNDMEMIGFLATAINTLERIKAKVEYVNVYGGERQ